MKGNELRQLLLYFCNKWCEEESNLIFNGSDFDPKNWQYSLGWHMWNKWIDACQNHNGSLDCIAWYLLDVDTENLTKFIDRVNECYKNE